MNLSPARHPGLDRVPQWEVGELSGDLRQELGALRAGADQRHPPQHHQPHLWQLIQTGPTHPAAPADHPLVINDSKIIHGAPDHELLAQSFEDEIAKSRANNGA